MVGVRNAAAPRSLLAYAGRIDSESIVRLFKNIAIQHNTTQHCSIRRKGPRHSTTLEKICAITLTYNVISPLPSSLARSRSRRPFPLFGSWSSSLLPFSPLPFYFPARLLALELSTSRRRCAVDPPPTPTLPRHHDASLTFVNADLPTFIIACCYILTLVSPTSYDPSTALFDWPARQILRSHLLFLFPLQPRTNGLLTIFSF